MGKLSLTKLTDLKLFFFIVRQVQIETPNEGVISVLAYNLENAIPSAKAKTPKGYQLKFTGNQPVKGILDAVESISKSVPGLKPEKSLQEIKKISVEQFKNNILLVADDFIKKDKDKIILKRIVKNL